jgi:quinohemoprotein ethanol dehydrogenase
VKPATAAVSWLSRAVALALTSTALLTGCQRDGGAPAPRSGSVTPGSEAHIRAVTGAVDEPWLRANSATTNDWPSYGLDAAETRYSRLEQIDDSNVGELGLVWTYDLASTRGVEATPLVVDGIMYVTASWSVVHAVDARTGRRLWSYDPEVPRSSGFKACCDVVNRGVALYKGKVYVGAFDGRLIALDAATGKPVWQQDTIIDKARPYTVTGAPRVIKGQVLIGNSGAEYGVRGYVTAYDAETGEQKWRWFTVPGDPAKPYENDAMARAAKTWDAAGKYWLVGGGGTVWDTIAHDPELDLMYIGTGNGSPWRRRFRSPAGGDNLYLASLVALRPDTGEYVWHYQETPGDNWDYTSTQPMILADLTIDGRPRKVILHAPKNGFFYVVDRTDGSFISATNFVEVNWASGYGADGRPIETAIARSADPADAIPGPFGAHNWHPMSFNPVTGLVYLPAQNVPINLADNRDWSADTHRPGEPHSNLGWNTSVIANAKAPQSKPFGRLIAWDPVARKEAWRQEHISPWNGGTLTSAGNLVFQGTADGRFIAFDATTGEKLWSSPVGTGIVAAPITYLVDGTQYVSIAVGWGGVYGLMQRAAERLGPGRVYTYALGGKAPLPEIAEYNLGALVSGVKYDPAHVADGLGLYVSNCVFCHGVPGVDRGGNIRNLGYVRPEVLANLDEHLFNPPMAGQGMPDFTGKLTADEVTRIQAFIQATADSIRQKAPD